MKNLGETVSGSKYNKIYKCEHIIELALRENLVDLPEDVMNSELKKRGPGAPRKAKSGYCLIKD